MADQPQQPSQGWGLPSDGAEPPDTPRPEYAYSQGPPAEPGSPASTSTADAPREPAGSAAAARPNGGEPDAAAGTGFGRFVPPPQELEERLRTVKTKTATPEPIAEPEPDMGVKPDEAMPDQEAIAEAQVAPAAPARTAPEPAGDVDEAQRSRRRALVIVGVLLLALIVVALIATGTVDVRGPQETEQDPTTTTTTTPATTPPPTTVPFDEALTNLSPDPTYRYQAPTPEDAMVAFIASVQERNIDLLEGLLDPEADVAAVEAKANAMLALPLSTLDSARRAVTCTTSGTQARCTAAGIAGESVFREDATSWRLVS